MYKGILNMNKIILIFLLFITSALAADPIGTVAILDGKVWRLPNSETKQKSTLETNQKIFEKDMIVTGKNAFVKILMNDDTVIDLGESTKFTFSEFKMKTKKDRKANYDFSYGKMRSIFTIKAKDEKSLKIKTPDVVMGVRGTEILADVYMHGKELKTDIALMSGDLNIEVDLKKQLKKFNIKPGEIFQSDLAKSFQDSKKVLTDLKSDSIKELKLKNIMERGKFLFDVMNRRSFPVNNELKEIIKGLNTTTSTGAGKNIDKSRNKAKVELSPRQKQALSNKLRDNLNEQIEKSKKPPTHYNQTHPDYNSSGAPNTNNSGAPFTNTPPGTQNSP